MNISVIKKLGIKIKNKRGDEVLALCPFHDDHNPSFSINLKKEVFYCFSCGAKGSFKQYGLAKKKTKVFWDSWGDLLSEDALETPISLPNEFESFMIGKTPYNRLYWNYVQDRGLSIDVIKEFGVGYCANGFYSDRIIIPLRTGYIARSIHNDQIGKLISKNFQRYYYPLGLQKSKILFNLGESKELILVEGVFDALVMKSYGYDVTSTLGSNLSQGQLEAICESKTESITLCFDGDDAGRIGMEKAANLLTPFYKSISIVKLPEGEDPAGCGEATLRRCLEMAMPFIKSYHSSFPHLDLALWGCSGG